MLTPLKQWICDKCGEIIESPKHGWLEWRQDNLDNLKAFDFKIVHHSNYSPHKPGGGDCYLLNEAGSHLDGYVGEDGLPALLCLLHRSVHIGIDPALDRHSSPDVKDIREWMELMRRLQVPNYEEARQYFDRASEDGRFEGVCGNIFRPEELKYIIEEYSTEPV